MRKKLSSKCIWSLSSRADCGGDWRCRNEVRLQVDLELKFVERTAVVIGDVGKKLSSKFTWSLSSRADCGGDRGCRNEVRLQVDLEPEFSSGLRW